MQLKNFLRNIFKPKQSVTLESINDLLSKVAEAEIKYQELLERMSVNSSANNLTVVSQKPVAECGEILNALIKRQNIKKS